MEKRGVVTAETPKAEVVIDLDGRLKQAEDRDSNLGTRLADAAEEEAKRRG